MGAMKSRDAQRTLKKLCSAPPPDFNAQYAALTAQAPWAALFWNWEYKDYMRPADMVTRRKVYEALKQAGLSTDGVSAAHLTLIRSITGA
jgi:hypothetical protein